MKLNRAFKFFFVFYSIYTDARIILNESIVRIYSTVPTYKGGRFFIPLNAAPLCFKKIIFPSINNRYE